MPNAQMATALEEKPDHGGFAYSSMLLLSITFQMSIFYLVNSQDKDIKAYAYKIIGTTIQIFSGVLIFFATNELTVHYVIAALPDEYEGFVLFGQFFFWIIIMKLVISWCCGVFAKEGGKIYVWSTNKFWLVATTKKKKIKQARQRNTECFGPLFGHVTAFSAIHAFGYLQQKTFLNSSPLTAYGASLLAFAGMLICFRLTTHARKFLMARYFPDKEEEEEKVYETVVDVENDVSGLATSFLAFLAVRFWLVSSLPPIDDKVLATPAGAMAEMKWLLAIGSVAFTAAFGVLFFKVHLEHVGKEKGEEAPWPACEMEEETSWPARLINIAMNFCIMTVAWITLLFNRLLVRWLNWFETVEEIPARIMVAFFISYAGFSLVWLLDKIDDYLRARYAIASEVDIVENIILGLGLAIGFAWEQSFDTAADDIADFFQDTYDLDPSRKVWIVGAVCIAAVMVVLPAYRFFIVKLVLKTKEEQDEEHIEIMSSFTPHNVGTKDAKSPLLAQ